MEDSAIPLDKWLVAVWLIANSKNGISSHELARALGISQKSGWFVLHRIRLAIHVGSFDNWDGEIEVDETYIGGKARNMHKPADNRTPFERFENLTRRIVAVPKKEVDDLRKKQQQARRRAKQRRA
ncbi:MAG TPA: hypothetical protein VG144_12970 [Gaiellaceae bacterium]|nr:hypothetical protein [Gaiellaceae bacterium]